MTASERLPASCLVVISGEAYIRIGGEDWQPNLIRVADFNERFADISDAPEFFAALEAHPAAQTVGWKTAIQWLKAQD